MKITLTILLTLCLVLRLCRRSELSAARITRCPCHFSRRPGLVSQPSRSIASFGDLKWFEVFKDPALQELIRHRPAGKL